MEKHTINAGKRSYTDLFRPCEQATGVVLMRFGSNHGASDFFALRKKIGHFWRKYEGTAVVALHKFDDDLGRLVRLVLV
jgi:hypothetical protein